MVDPNSPPSHVMVTPGPAPGTGRTRHEHGCDRRHTPLEVTGLERENVGPAQQAGCTFGNEWYLAQSVRAYFSDSSARRSLRAQADLSNGKRGLKDPSLCDDHVPAVAPHGSPSLLEASCWPAGHNLLAFGIKRQGS